MGMRNKRKMKNVYNIMRREVVIGNDEQGTHINEIGLKNGQ